MKTVFMYAGQGSQQLHMGQELYEQFPEYRAVIDSLSMSEDIKALMAEPSFEEISKTEHTQPLMSAFAAGVTAVLKQNGIVPDAAFGLSLGEYGALHAAGVFDADTYIQLTAYRGKIMADATAQAPTCMMSAIFGLESSVVEAACLASRADGYVTVANYNCPGQYVISGDAQAVEAAEKRLKAAGAKRCIRLKVTSPFHTEYMDQASEQLKKYMDEVSFNRPDIQVVLNVTGDFYDGQTDLKEMLKAQIKSSVQLEESIRQLGSAGYDHFVEIGPGRVLSGFVKKTAKVMNGSISVASIESAASLRDYIEQRKERI